MTPPFNVNQLMFIGLNLTQLPQSQTRNLFFIECDCLIQIDAYHTLNIRNLIVKSDAITMADEKVESLLKGNTLRVYWHLLKTQNGSVGARETQRALKFSSPALAVYHLDKLEELGLAEKTMNGEYRLVKAVNVGVLKQFVRFGALMLPRHFFYATMFTTLLVFFVFQVKRIDFNSSFALVITILATTVAWYETLRVWRQKP